MGMGAEVALAEPAELEFPLTLGSIQIDLGTIWHRVCASPASVSVTMENKG